MKHSDGLQQSSAAAFGRHATGWRDCCCNGRGPTGRRGRGLAGRFAPESYRAWAIQKCVGIGWAVPGLGAVVAAIARLSQRL